MSGQLTLERQKGGNPSQPSGRMCPFKLSSPLAARRYVKEFMGIFTEEGRKFVKITHERETRAGREIMEMQTGEKMPNAQTTKVQTIPSAIITQQPLQQLPQPPSTSITSPPPPALVATPQAALKLAAAAIAPQRIITTRPTGQQVVVLAQVKQESPGNQVIKNLLNQPRAPMTNTMVNGLTPETVQTVYLQVDNSNLIHMTGAGVPTSLQVWELGTRLECYPPVNINFKCNFLYFISVPTTHSNSGYASHADLYDERANCDAAAGDSREETSRYVVRIKWTTLINCNVVLSINKR